jgi:Ca2+-binding EF-hand superfamily protein
MEFCNSVRAFGYAGNLKSLWKELDADGEGFVSLAEFCPDIAELMQNFYACLKGKHEGSLVKAWAQSMDPDKSGKCNKDEFLAAMEKVGFTGDANRVYNLLDFDHSGHITLEELDPASAEEEMRKRKKKVVAD